MTRLFPNAARPAAGRSWTSASFPSECRLPLLQEFKALGLIEAGKEVRRNRNGLDGAAELLGKRDARALARDVGPYRIQLSLLGRDRLPALRQEVVDPALARIGIFRILGHALEARVPGAVVGAQRDPHRRVLL